MQTAKYRTEAHPPSRPDQKGTPIMTPHNPDHKSATETASADAFRGLPLLLAVPRAATILGISRASAYRLAAAGELPTRHLGGRVYIVTERLRDFIDGADSEEAA